MERKSSLMAEFLRRASEMSSGTSRRSTWLLTLAKSTQRHYIASSPEYAALEVISDFLRQQEAQQSSLASQLQTLADNAGSEMDMSLLPPFSQFISNWMVSNQNNPLEPF